MSVRDLILTPWRKIYWWNKSRINPFTNKRLIRKFLAERSVIKLELGSSKRDDKPDWIASDINGFGDIKMDFTKPLPFPDNSVDIIYSSHVLEHFSYPDPMMGFLKECRRILKPSGQFSIAVPNAALFVDAYLNPEEFDHEKYCYWDVGLSYKTPIDYLNFVAYLGNEHRHLFDIDGLKAILDEAGFSRVNGRDYDADIDLDFRRDESIYAIASV